MRRLSAPIALLPSGLRQHLLLLRFRVRRTRFLRLDQVAAFLRLSAERQRCLGAAVLVGIAAAIEVGLRLAPARVSGLRGALAVDQNDVERAARVALPRPRAA